MKSIINDPSDPHDHRRRDDHAFSVPIDITTFRSQNRNLTGTFKLRRSLVACNCKPRTTTRHVIVRMCVCVRLNVPYVLRSSLLRMKTLEWRSIVPTTVHISFTRSELLANVLSKTRETTIKTAHSDSKKWLFDKSFLVTLFVQEYTTPPVTSSICTVRKDSLAAQQKAKATIDATTSNNRTQHRPS
jgi:hypothetical protein